jgi:DNA repair protein RadC
MEQNIKMKELAEQDRPREKLLLKGPQALTDTELLAILLGSGNVEKSALELARVVYQYYGNKLAKLSQLSLQDWEKTKGIGPSKAATLLACFELGRRKSSESIAKETAVKSSVDAFKYFHSVLGDLIHEEWV